MGQRVVLGVSLAEAAGGVYTQGRERGRGRVCGRDYGRLGCWREGELSMVAYGSVASVCTVVATPSALGPAALEAMLRGRDGGRGCSFECR